VHAVFAGEPLPGGLRGGPAPALDSLAQLPCGLFRQPPHFATPWSGLAPRKQCFKAALTERLDPFEDNRPRFTANVGNLPGAVLAGGGEPDAQKANLPTDVFLLPVELIDLGAQVRPPELELSCAHSPFRNTKPKKGQLFI
jgi:hypothetical protein